MDWQNKYFSYFNENLIPDKLWIYYHTRTEIYDRTLNPICPSMHEEGIVIPYGESRKQSEQNARETYKFIYGIAYYYGISDEQMDLVERRVGYMKQIYIEREYQVIKDQNGFKFIDDYVEYLNSIMRKKTRRECI